MKPIQAIQKKIDKGIETDWKLYDFIHDNPDLSMYAIHKRLGWSIGKVQKAVKRLEERGYVKSEIEYNSTRPRRIIKIVGWKEVYKMLKEEGLEE